MALVDQLSDFGWKLVAVVGAFAIGMGFFVIGLLVGVIASRVG